MQRTIAYIDGFNLYYGLKQKRWRRYYWLNVQRLMQELLKPQQHLVGTKYFTSRISSTPSDPHKHKRQGTYLEALQTLPDLRIFYGHYLQKPVRCRQCGSRWRVHDEKMTDVNIAVELMVDAFQDAFDTALLISGDSDLVGPVRAVTRLFPGKRVVVGFPPARFSRDLQRAASAYLVIHRRSLAASLLPNEVPKPDGYVLRKPSRWT